MILLTYIKKIRQSKLCVTGVYLGACLHYSCIRQKQNQRLLNCHYRHEGAATDHTWLSSDKPSGLLACSQFVTWGSFQGFRCPFWSCDQREVYFWPVKTSIFRNHIQFFIQPNNAFCMRYHIIMLHILFNPKLKELYVSAFHLTKICWIWSSSSLQNRGQWGCGMDLNMIRVQSNRTCSRQFTSGQCQAGDHLVGWPAQNHTRDLKDTANTIFPILHLKLRCLSICSTCEDTFFK